MRQAESFSTQSGTQTESTTDTGGGQNVGYITPGDWLPTTMSTSDPTSPATVTTRIASGATASGTIQYRLDSTTGPVIATVPVNPTGGWQTWTSRDHHADRVGHRRAPVYLTFTGTAGVTSRTSTGSSSTADAGAIHVKARVRNALLTGLSSRRRSYRLPAFVREGAGRTHSMAVARSETA